MGGFHSTATGASMHGPYYKVFANTAGRTGDATVYTAAQSSVGGSANPIRALQLDTATEYYLSNHSPTTWTAFASATDEKAKVSSNDTTPGYLNGKLVAGSGVTFTENNDGGNETLTIAASGGGSFDIRDLVMFDHFMSGTDLTNRIGALGWVNLVSGTGADVIFNGETGHPGIMDAGAGSTAAGRAGIYLGDTTFTLQVLQSVQNEINMEWLLRLNTAALSATNNERFTMGWGDGWDASSGVEHTNGIYLEFNPTLSANFRLVTKASGTATRTDSTIAVAAATWYRIVFQITYPSSVPTAKLFINGTERASATANFPSAGLGIGIRLDSNTNSAEPRWQVDYMKLVQVTNKET